MPQEIKRLVIFDFDGTLSEIVPGRGEARLHGENRLLLHELAAIEKTVAAVLSSRRLDDILSRVDVPGIYIGGGSGLEWFVPGKGKSAVPQKIRQEADRTRAKTVDLIRSLERCRGIIVEDKFWSIAVHTRSAPEGSRQAVKEFLRDCAPVRRLKKFRGPEVVDIALVPGLDKASGVQRLCDLTGVDLKGVALIYAGDDENDAQAMAWVIRNGGTAITVGDRPLAPGSLVVREPGGLAGEVRKLLMEPPNTIKSRL
jgi:trehalose 6-phosphate phosphatase